MIIINDGVDVRNLHIKMWDALYTILPLFESKGKNLIVTSALDGKHGWGSLHYVGCAVDIRRWGIDLINEFVNLIKDILPSGFDVVLEDTHIHIEWQPKTQDESRG